MIMIPMHHNVEILGFLYKDVNSNKVTAIDDTKLE